MCLKILIYSFYKRKTIKEIKKKNKIKVVFLVLYESMWKCDDLFKLFLNNNRYDPYIISIPYPSHPRQFSIDNQNSLEKYFKDKQFPFIRGCEFNKSDRWFDLKAFSPDIIFYQQPYNAGHHNFKIEKLWKKSLFAYVPYCFNLSDNKEMFNTLLCNIAWKQFLLNDFLKKDAKRYALNRAKNVVVTGFPFSDILMNNKVINRNIWKIKDTSVKRVIWAPHHSITSHEVNNYSIFLNIADFMLELAKKYEGVIQFAFKPHPVLKRKLYLLPEWGKEKTDSYFLSWVNNSNTCLVEGDYIDLFKSSDAMIHDCSSFCAEYLYTLKPVLFIAKSKGIENLNEFGKKCVDQHYRGNSENDILEFINNIVLYEKDPMLESRRNFLNDCLLPSNKKKASLNIFDSINQSL